MERAYHTWHSPHLERDMELLVFGSSGERIVVFPTRGGRFYDYEDWGLIRAASPRIEAGALQLFCVDSIDLESLYDEAISPRERIRRHLDYEAYLLHELIPFSEWINPRSPLTAHGCSLGAYHAVSLALRHPQMFRRAVALSGRYDLTTEQGPYRDLFDGYYDDDIYFNNPSHFLANMWDEALLTQLRKLEIIFAIGCDDAFYDNNCALEAQLSRLGIPHTLHLWEGEAHRARYWRRMVAEYL